ncbi:MAG: NAD(P)/FAD-dependent oxidoreductase [Nanoarchaeota archaeon]|nr:NAD(P)/FAD-dependent oxidoreductase [Nanoarchaeota archaeon]
MENNKKLQFEIVILGDGAGANLARKLAQFGYKIALIGHGRPGGTCLNRGCIPSKKLIAPIFKIHEAIKTLQKYSISNNYKKEELDELKVINFINFKKLKEEVLKEVSQDSLNSKEMMISGKIENLTYFSSHATFVDDFTLKLEDETIISYDKIVIATGSRPRVPSEIKGIDSIEYDTSTEALFSQDEISKYTILGGGVIACELGALYAACGVEVTILATGGLLRPIDDMLKKKVEQYLEELGITIIKKVQIEKIEEKNSMIKIDYSKEKLSQSLITPRLLVALGIAPNTDSLYLDNTSIEITQRGFIEVDDLTFKIKNSNHMFAIGDCVGKSQLRHGAGFEAREVFKQLVLGEKSVLSQDYMPYGIYLGTCEVAGCGKTSQQLKKERVDFQTYTKDFETTVYGKAKGLKGTCVIHYHSNTLEILGSHIFGNDAVNLNQILVPYIEEKKTLFDLSDTISPHPSLAEGLFTISIREIVYEHWKKDLNK